MVRLKRDGLNKLPKAKKDGLLKIFFKQFLSPLIYILIVTVILSFVIGETIDAIFVILVILIDACLSTFQEWRAGKQSESFAKPLLE